MEKNKFDIKFEESLTDSLKNILEIIGKENLEKIIQSKEKYIENDSRINGFRPDHLELEIIMDIFYSQIKVKKQKLLKEKIKSIFEKELKEVEDKVLELKEDEKFNKNFYNIINKSSFKDNLSMYLEFSDKSYDENIEEKYNNYKIKLKEVQEKNKTLEFKHQLKHRNFNKELKEVEKKHKEVIKSLEKEIETLKEEKGISKKASDFLESENEKLKLENKRIGKESDKLKQKIGVLNEEMEEFLDRFNVILKNNSKDKNESYLENIHIYKLSKENNTEEQKEILNMEEFIDEFSDNLESLGLTEDNTKLAMYIYSILSSNQNILLVGYGSIDIANAFSNTICSKNVDIINIPMGYNNSNELIDVVKNCKGEVVIINNVLDAISEDVYLPLLKLDMKKTIIFTVESKENLNLISNYLSDYLVPIDIEEFANQV